MTEPPDTTTPRFETLQRVEAAHLRGLCLFL